MDANKAKDVVVLLVPVEESEEQAVYNFETMPDNWLMLSHDSSHVKMLQKKFNIRTVPKVVSCKSNSTVLTMKGRTEIENKGAYAIYNWIELARAKPKHGGLVFVDMIDEEKAQAGKQT